MARIYRVPFVATTVTNAGGNADLWTFSPADDKPIALMGFRLGQTSELGDANEENLDITIEHLAATVTITGGTSVTPVPCDPGISDLAAGFTSTIFNSTVTTTNGTKTIMEALGWNERSTPLEIWFPDVDYAPKCRQASGLVIRMNSTVADDITFIGCAYIQEF